MTPRNRTLDLMRLVASFGVITIHCAPRTSGADFVCDLFSNVCVPFFLLSSLVLFWREAAADGASGHALRRRVPRLLLPYLSWSAIYLAARGLKFLLSGQSLHTLFNAEEAPALLFCGGAAVQLYFLPVLLLGLVLAWALQHVLPRKKTARTACLAALAAAGAVLLLAPSSIADLLAGVRLPHAAVLYLDWLGWLLAPVASAALLAEGWPQIRAHALSGWAVLALATLADVLLVAQVVPHAWRFHSFVLAVLLVVAAERLRRPFPASEFTGLVLRSGFGIFLVHHLVLEGIELFSQRTGRAWSEPYSLLSLILVCGATFVVSLAFTLVVSRQRLLARALLGA